MSLPPSGITPAASFELAGFEPQEGPPVILADLIDPLTGDFGSLTTGRGIADGMAIHLMNVHRGTGAAVRSFGHRFREITHANEDAPEKVERFTRQALEPGIESGTLRFDRVEAVVNAEDKTQVDNVVRYVDLLAPRRDRNRTITFRP